MLQLDKKTVSELEAQWVEKIKIFFYGAGCSGKKINMTTDFELTDELVELHTTPILSPARRKGLQEWSSSLLAGENWERCKKPQQQILSFLTFVFVFLFSFLRKVFVAGDLLDFYKAHTREVRFYFFKEL